MWHPAMSASIEIAEISRFVGPYVFTIEWRVYLRLACLKNPKLKSLKVMLIVTTIIIVLL